MVEPICRLLPIAPSICYEVISKCTDVDRLSARARRDIAMKVEIRRVFDENFQVYGCGKSSGSCYQKNYDIARRIVGWRASRTAHAGFMLDSFDQAS
ncbi:hypothetical protein Brsp03_00186 [Brucella sp. NBRC 12951]|nr:hypothetical protein [Brucella anthropi]